jgi:alpha-1,2-mannosyltransferase
LFLITGGYSFQSLDTDAASTPAWALVRTGSLDLNDTRGLLSPTLLTNDWYVETVNGLLSNRFPGVIAYSVPFYWLAESLGIDSRWAPGVVAAATVTAAAVALMSTTLAALGLSRRLTVASSLFFGLGTATWTVSADAQWPHGIDQLLIVLGVRLMAGRHPTWAGLVLGMTALTRPQLAPAVLLLAGAWAGWARDWRLFARFAIFALLGTGLLVLYNGLLFGSWRPDSGVYLYGVSQSAESQAAVSDLVLNLGGTLVDPLRGVLVYYPALITVAFGLAPAWRRAPPWVRAAAAAGVVALLTQLTLNRFSGGDSFFGSRITIESLTLAYPLLVLGWVEMPSAARRIAVPLLGWSVLLHSIGALAYPWAAAGLVPVIPLVGLASMAAILGFLLVLRAVKNLEG